MKVVLGELNRVFLADLFNEAMGKCMQVRAAIAYADNSNLVSRKFFEDCISNKKRLQYFGLLCSPTAIPVPLLEFLADDQSGYINCKLVNGHFHPKIIWWEGFGAYIGSANLTHNGWFRNVEAGVFLSEEELENEGVGEELRAVFAYLNCNSLPLTRETCAKLRILEQQRKQIDELERRLKQTFEAQFSHQLPQKGLTVVQVKQQSSYAKEWFVKEWFETLQLIRNLSKQFNSFGLRPVWVLPEVHPTAHFDQFLHAYYYGFVRGSDDELKSVEQVERSYQQNKSNVDAAMRAAAEWWAGLPNAPFNEDEFITQRAPYMERVLRPEKIRSMTLDDFAAAMSNVHSFRTHARQVKNVTLGLPREHKEDMFARMRHLAEWVWKQRSNSGHTVLEVLQFVLYGNDPADMELRLWEAVAGKSGEWRISHFGKSILGETVGWARPNDYPPRNNRTNKALRALGFDVTLFSRE